MKAAPLPQVIADLPVASAIEDQLRGRVSLLPWADFEQAMLPHVVGVYTYGHPTLEGAMLDRVPNAKVISNYGVGVDHIQLDAAILRGIPVGNTPGVLDGATADMGFCLLLAAGRRLAEGDRYARSPACTQLDPCYMLGREIHGATLGILGMGRIGYQVARRAGGFDMRVIYHNRTRREVAERELGVDHVSFERLFRESDYLMVCVPLSDKTRSIVGATELAWMKPTATLINIARGAVVDSDALVSALSSGAIYAAGLDVTEPEPLPRDHPLLSLENVIITPHLGSATVQTRQKMAEISCQNLLAGLEGRDLLHRVG